MATGATARYRARLATLFVGAVALACESEPAGHDAPPTPPQEAEKPPAAEKPKAFSEGDCAAYCNKQAACFPRAIDVPKERWSASCQAFCADDAKEQRPVTRLHAAVVACADEPCGDPFGACIAKAIDGAALEIDPRGLHDNCYAFRACVDARVYRFPFETKNAREDIYNENRPIFDSMKKVTDVSGTGCRGLVESALCGFAAPRKPEGEPIEMSCDDYCSMQAKCFPKHAASPEWSPRCKLTCEEEAKLGTAAAHFFSAVASCKEDPCGDQVGQCVATRLDRSSASWQWDVRGLGGKCSWLRMCLEAGLHESESEAAGVSRKAMYKSYARSFGDLKHTKGDSAAYCETLIGYQPKCK